MIGADGPIDHVQATQPYSPCCSQQVPIEQGQLPHARASALRPVPQRAPKRHARSGLPPSDSIVLWRPAFSRPQRGDDCARGRWPSLAVSSHTWMWSTSRATSLRCAPAERQRHGWACGALHICTSRVHSYRSSSVAPQLLCLFSCRILERSPPLPPPVRLQPSCMALSSL